MSASAHSPLPWRLDGLVIRDAEGEVVLDLEEGTPGSSDLANAELILAAVNVGEHKRTDAG